MKNTRAARRILRATLPACFIGLGACGGAPENIDAGKQWLTPGLIDVHSHMGVYPAPATKNHADDNEMAAPLTAEVWAKHSVWPRGPQCERALACGQNPKRVCGDKGNSPSTPMGNMAGYRADETAQMIDMAVDTTSS